MNSFERPFEDPITLKAEALFVRIMEDLNPEEFTIGEIKQEFNHLTKNPPGGDYVNMNFIKRDLDILSKAGYISESEEGKYFVTDQGRRFYDELDIGNNEE